LSGFIRLKKGNKMFNVKFSCHLFPVIFLLAVLAALTNGTVFYVKVAWATTYHPDPIPIESSKPDMKGEALPGGSTEEPIIQTIAGAPESGESRLINLFLEIIIGLLVLSTAGIAYLFWERFWITAKLKRDYRRKADLNAIQSGIGAFYKLQGYYPIPVKGEYSDVLESLPEIPKDPKEGQPTGFETDRFGYYYENMISGPQKEEGFLLWTYLENLKDPQIEHTWDKKHQGTYLLTSESEVSEAKLVISPYIPKLSLKEIKCLPKVRALVFSITLIGFGLSFLGLFILVFIILMQSL